jgi:hypothetical protein
LELALVDKESESERVRAALKLGSRQPFVEGPLALPQTATSFDHANLNCYGVARIKNHSELVPRTKEWHQVLTSQYANPFLSLPQHTENGTKSRVLHLSTWHLASVRGTESKPKYGNSQKISWVHNAFKTADDQIHGFRQHEV